MPNTSQNPKPVPYRGLNTLLLIPQRVGARRLLGGPWVVTQRAQYSLTKELYLKSVGASNYDLSYIPIIKGYWALWVVISRVIKVLGSWKGSEGFRVEGLGFRVVKSGGISEVAILITYIRGLITPPIYLP